MNKIAITSVLILCISTEAAQAKCKVKDGLKWTVGGAVAGVAVALYWGGAAIAAPFTAGGSLAVAAATTGVTFSAIASAVAVSAGSTIVIGKAGALAGGVIGAGIEAGDCLVKDK